VNTTLDPDPGQRPGDHCLHLTIRIAGNFIPSFLGLVRSGFAAPVTVGCSLQDLLSSQLGIDENYLRDRVQTIFLNNSPVDDTVGTTVGDGAAISLSAAMPGLNGAVMRKGGVLASLRRSISQLPNTECIAPRPGKITLKLFNLVAKEIGPDFLYKGIVVKGRALFEILAMQPPQFWQNVKQVEIDSVRWDADQLRNFDMSRREVFLQVRPA